MLLFVLDHGGNRMHDIVLCDLQTRQARHQVAHRLQMGQQIVELDDERQEIISRQVRLLLKRLQVIFERMRAALDGG